MKLDEFEDRFDAFWQERYSLYDPNADHWTKERADTHAKQQCRDMLLTYAREVQMVGVSRRGKNKPQRLFDEMCMHPTEVELSDAEPVSRSSDVLDVSKNQGRAAGRVIYIERKAGQLTGEARIGRVHFSKSGRTLKYGGQSFRSLNGAGFKSNYYCVETGENYWISGCKRNGTDRLYGERVPIHIDEDVREEYWAEIRCKPECKERDVV